MAPPLSKVQLELLNKIFYKEQFFFGRDKLYAYISDKYADYKISRRQIADFLKYQEVNQIYAPSKGKLQFFKSSMTSEPNVVLAIDLVNMEKFEVRGFKYLFNAIDMSSRFIYSEAMLSKNEADALKVFKKIYKKSKIRAIHSDQDNEFINKFKKYLKENDIKQILSEPNKAQSNGTIERTNATIKELIQKSIELNEKYDWVKKLQKLISNINNTQHRIKGFTPKQI